MIVQTSIQSPKFLEWTNANSGLNKRPPYTHGQELVAHSDEELCGKAQRGCTVSQERLWHRYSDYLQKIVHNENKRQCLPQHEIADALQEVYFAFHKAVQRYDPENHCRGKPASFKHFLRIVVAHQFSNYCALWRIYHRRMVLDCDGKTLPSLTEQAVDGRGCTPVVCADLLSNEFCCDSLAEALPRLKSKERYLLEVWLQYGRDKEVAKVLGISPAAAKLRRERLFRRIRSMIEP